MQFLMLFRMTYLEAKFDLVVLEKSEIYRTHALKMKCLVERSLFQPMSPVF
jgi:hypothetical protein